MKNLKIKDKKTIWLVVGIVVSLVLIGSVFWLVNREIQDTKKTAVSPSPSPTPQQEEKTPGIFEVTTETNKCETRFEVTPQGEPNLSCARKEVWRDNINNLPGEYVLKEKVGETDEVKVGEVLVYVIRLVNGGEAGVGGATVKDRLSSYLEYVDGDGGCTENQGEVVCAVGKVAANGEAMVAFRVRVKEGSEGKEIENLAQVIPDEGSVSSCQVIMKVEDKESPTPTPTPSPTPTPTPTTPTPDSPEPTPELSENQSPVPSSLPKAGIMEITVQNASIGAILVGLGLLGLLLLP